MIQSEVLAHHSQADQSNITLIRIHFSIFFSNSLKQGATHCSEHLNLMANPVCEVLLTEAQLNAPENRVDLAAGASVDFLGSCRAAPKMDAKSTESNTKRTAKWPNISCGKLPSRPRWNLG